jgi:hypothetical protein
MRNYCLKHIAIAGCGLLAAATMHADAGATPNISELVSNVAKTILPDRTYRATVHQSVALMNGNGSNSNGTTITNITQRGEEADYLVIGEVSGALRPTKGIALKRAVPASPASTSISGPAQNLRLMVTVNAMDALRHIEKLGSGTITNEIYKGIPCYTISATDGQFTFVVWVTASDSSVPRLVILQDSSTLFDTEFTYQKWNGGLVPSHVVISKPSNGTRIDQVFTGHAY